MLRGYFCDPIIRVICRNLIFSPYPAINIMYRNAALKCLHLLILCLPGFVMAQEEGLSGSPAKTDKAGKGPRPSRNFMFTPFLAPSFAPETDLMINAGGLISWSFDKTDTTLQRTALPFFLGYSTNGSFAANVRPSLFSRGDRLRLNGDIWLRDMPDNYWGVGYERASTTPKGDSTTAYTRHWWQVFLRITYRIRPSLYGGILVDFNHTNARDLNPEMAADPNILNDGTKISNSAIGLLVQYDTRDVVLNAYRGIFVELSAIGYGGFLGGDFDYQAINLDLRHYRPIRRDGRTLAFQVRSRWVSDGAPWPEMSTFGTPFDLRGYTQGWFRDRAVLFGITEYRHMFMRKNPRRDGSYMSRFGINTWIATGSIAQNYGGLKNWLPNGGLGLRFEVQPRMNARVDLGFGRNVSAVYVSFNEAF
jgi:hypothetical protein